MKKIKQGDVVASLHKLEVRQYKVNLLNNYVKLRDEFNWGRSRSGLVKPPKFSLKMLEIVS